MPNTLMRHPRWRAMAGIALSAVLLAVYARGGLAWCLGFVALVPWLWTLDRASTLRGALVSGLLMSMAFTAAVFAWFGVALGQFTGWGAPLGVVTLLVLAPLLQPQVIAFALVRHAVGRRHGAAVRAAAGAAAWVACEWAWPKLLGDTLGHGLHPSALMRQVADLGGAPLLTVLLLLCNDAVLAALARRAAGMRALVRPVATGVAIVAGMAGYGAWRLSTLQAPPADAATLRIAMVQASITNYERLRREMGGAYPVVRKVLDTHYALSWSALRDHGADALLWSETVYPTTYGNARSEDGALLDREIQGFVDAAGVPLVFGTYDLDEAGEYNAAAFLEPGRATLGMYRKTHPFPLTEHVPRWLDTQGVRRLLPWMGTWQAGNGARVLPLRSRDGREVQVLPLICLDDVKPQLAIDGARLGAQAIVGMSNDAWFSATPQGARLHLQVAAFRSIETRLPQVRVTTNGLSAIVDDRGAVLASTRMGQQSVLTAFVSAVDPPLTLMVRWGDWVGRACLVGLLAWWAVLAARGWSARRGGAPAPAAHHVQAAVLTPALRWAVAALRVGAALGLAWLAWDMLRRTGFQVQSLAQLRVFALAVVLPLLLAWLVERSTRARVHVDAATLVLDQRRRRIEIPLASLDPLRPWRVALPGVGTWLTTQGTPPWRGGLRTDAVQALRQQLAQAGAAAAGAPMAWTQRESHAQARADARHRLLDHAAVRFGLFPLLPALVAFRLHQVIAFGGPFGEWLTYGPVAWSSGLALWWASWSLGLMLFAAACRVLIEAAAALLAWRWPAQAAAARGALEWAGRLAFYVGVPAWLLVRVAGG